MSDWLRLGPVVKTQIHVDRMIDAGRYLIDLIDEVDELWLGPDGVVGVRDGLALLHGHHRLHPNKLRAVRQKNYRPDRLLSFGFTGHYRLMEARFGQAPIGCAAEDIIVGFDAKVALSDVAGGLQLRRGDRVVELTGPAIAKPCVPFTKYLLRDQDAADEVIAPNRAFLDDGMRGFIVGLADQSQPVDVVVGDELWARAEH